MYFPKLAYKTAQERQHQESSERRGPKKFGLDRGTKGCASGIWSGEGLGAGNLAMQDSRFSHQFFFGCNPIIIWQPWTEKLFPFQKNIGISLPYPCYWRPMKMMWPRQWQIWMMPQMHCVTWLSQPNAKVRRQQIPRQSPRERKPRKRRSISMIFLGLCLHQSTASSWNLFYKEICTEKFEFPLVQPRRHECVIASTFCSQRRCREVPASAHGWVCAGASLEHGGIHLAICSFCAMDGT